jgi:transcriptional regulator GlxA family with amidase domain
LPFKDGEKIQFFMAHPLYYKRKTERNIEMTTIGIIAFDGVLTSELIAPAEVFALAGDFDIKLISVEQVPTIRTEEGIQISVDATIQDELTLDVLLVPGGNDMSDLLQHEKLNGFIQKQANTAQWLGSFCAGAFVLGNAGVLDDTQATTWFGGESSLQTQFPAIQVVHDKPVVMDNRRITSNGGLVSYRAALMLLAQLRGAEKAQTVYNSLSLDRIGTWQEIQAQLV